jgi:hypothetical protein
MHTCGEAEESDEASHDCGCIRSVCGRKYDEMYNSGYDIEDDVKNDFRRRNDGVLSAELNESKHWK